ncbi:MAG TPA: pitrilysin family protein [Candidatus Kapabacteria bacterium]|nr:pitrilysin family protein [Candidatus Kapabacteria bacterium]
MPSKKKLPPNARPKRERFTPLPHRASMDGGILGVAARYLRPEEIAPVDVELRTYPNGLRVVSERVTGASSLALGLWVKVGSRDENRRNNGIAHFIEHVVFKGTAGRTMREIMRSIESRGGYLNAFTTKEHTCFYTWTRTTHLEESVSVLFDLATRPKFSAADIEHEKAVIIEEINGIEDEPDELVFDLFENEIFGKHPLAKPIIGTPETVSRFTRKKLAEFHKKHYRASDIVIAASGSHAHEDLFRAIDRAIRHVPPHIPRRAAPAVRFPRLAEMERHFPRAGGQQAHIILGRRAPGIHSNRHLAINALITIAGAGMSSRLNLRLREELGLAYDAAAFYAPFEDTATVGFYIATAIDNRKRALREMRRIARGLITKPISAIELDRAKEQLIGSLVLPMESVTNRMMRSAQNELYFGGYHPIERDVEKIARLTLEEVRREAARLFEDDSSLLLVSVVPDQDNTD